MTTILDDSFAFGLIDEQFDDYPEELKPTGEEKTSSFENDLGLNSDRECFLEQNKGVKLKDKDFTESGDLIRGILKKAASNPAKEEKKKIFKGNDGKIILNETDHATTEEKDTRMRIELHPDENPEKRECDEECEEKEEKEEKSDSTADKCDDKDAPAQYELNMTPRGFVSTNEFFNQEYPAAVGRDDLTEYRDPEPVILMEDEQKDDIEEIAPPVFEKEACKDEAVPHILHAEQDPPFDKVLDDLVLEGLIIGDDEIRSAPPSSTVSMKDEHSGKEGKSDEVKKTIMFSLDEVDQLFDDWDSVVVKKERKRKAPPGTTNSPSFSDTSHMVGDSPSSMDISSSTFDLFSSSSAASSGASSATSSASNFTSNSVPDSFQFPQPHDMRR